LLTRIAGRTDHRRGEAGARSNRTDGSVTNRTGRRRTGRDAPAGAGRYFRSVSAASCRSQPVTTRHHLGIRGRARVRFAPPVAIDRSAGRAPEILGHVRQRGHEAGARVLAPGAHELVASTPAEAAVVGDLEVAVGTGQQDHAAMRRRRRHVDENAQRDARARFERHHALLREGAGGQAGEPAIGTFAGAV
jgi:hypothetical protein